MNKFSPKKYLKEKAGKLPIEACLVSDNYENDGLTMCLIIRKQPSGKYVIANILIDRLCLGVKNSFANCNVTPIEKNKLIEKMQQHGSVVNVSPGYFHNLVYGAIDFAAELRFNPPKDFYLAEYVLDDNFIDDGIDTLEMGRDGKTLYIEGPHDNTKKIISILKSSVGEGGYDYIHGSSY